MNKKMTFIKSLTLILTLFGSINFGFGQTTLAKEDIAIIGVNIDNQDFSFLLRTDIEAGTTIYFSDNDVNLAGTGLIDENEGMVLFTSSIDYPCGSVLSFIANSLEFTTIDNIFDLDNKGDEVLAFQGFDSNTLEWTTFLHANVKAALANLPVGFTAADIVDGTSDNREYNGSTTSPTWADLNNISNYDEKNNYNSVTLSTSAFTCGPCSTTVTWNGTAWDNNTGPDLTTEAILDGDYNTTNGGSFSACSLTVNAGFTLTISDVDTGAPTNTYVEVQNDVIVDGGVIRVESKAALVQNNDLGTFTTINAGTGELVKTTRSYTDDGLHYVYWSSPVKNMIIETAFPNPYLGRRYYFDASLFLDEHTVGTTNSIPDDIDDNANDWQTANGAMEAGRGYVVATVPPPPVGWSPGDPYSDQGIFSGDFNTGDIPVPVFRDDSFLGDTNWNLLGNPYPSAISAQAFLLENYYDGSSGTLDGVIYLWTHNSVADAANPGNEVYNFSQDDYATINISGAVSGAPSGGEIPNGNIPSGQGFFASYANLGDFSSVTGGIATGEVRFTNAMRMADESSNSQFFKVSNTKNAKSNENTNKLWVNLTSDNGVFNQSLIAYLGIATDKYDGDAFDAPKKFSTDYSSILYTIIPDSDKKFAIQGKAESSLNQDEVIKLGFDTSIDVPTVYNLSIAKLQGDFMNNNPVYLKDNLLNKLNDLSASDYSFTSDVGEFKDRFEIVFNSEALSNDTFDTTLNNLQIKQVTDTQVRFSTYNNLSIKNVRIYDLLGRQLYDLDGNNREETYNLSNLNNSVFIAKVELSNGALITKKAIKK